MSFMNNNINTNTHTNIKNIEQFINNISPTVNNGSIDITSDNGSKYVTFFNSGSLQVPRDTNAEILIVGGGGGGGIVRIKYGMDTSFIGTSLE